MMPTCLPAPRVSGCRSPTSASYCLLRVLGIEPQARPPQRAVVRARHCWVAVVLSLSVATL